MTTGSWRELLGPRNLGASTVLAGGVALYATNEFLTISLLPSAVADIGGQRFYAWVTTVYLVASVVAATTVSAVLARIGPRWAYMSGLGVFGLGSLLCAMAPTMELLLVGRVVQGAAGGLLAGLGYAVINSALPQSLWTKASALVSAMWGVGTLLGPAAGGLFAQFGSWRWAFGVLVALSAAIAALVPSRCPPARATARRCPTGSPCGRCCCLARRRWRSASQVSRAAWRGRRSCLRRARAWSRCSSSSIVGRSGGVAAHGLSARPAQVDLPDPRRADGRDHGRLVRAAVRSAAGAPGAGRRRLSRGGAGGRVDDERD